MTMQRWLLPCEGIKRQCAKKNPTHITIVTHSSESQTCHILSPLLEAVLIRKPSSFSLLPNASISPLPTQTHGQVPPASLNQWHVAYRNHKKKNSFIEHRVTLHSTSVMLLMHKISEWNTVLSDDLSIWTNNSPVRCGRIRPAKPLLNVRTP